ncbi:2-polyprenyl-6-methoxyphenol hydroxylase-like FAD-dependent oxidoreductase [Hephaestia caeni]|uniref:2-polyprenyl-6-methoxyphenol hydroxylase-like FAD-dependent oxidoreductase n=1 Tax=Hephaestia caeni TaxID=645617 RepID=A0A397PD06_9SPHN|nr:FAD-dependent oxidoreductase [Hephaestia caeni]RIA45799.1 2-polyprenyl-6-methoxyphenol hydroxylase-like FAD-dependent oxidoreductase [Hephaestia caeni]
MNKFSCQVCIVGGGPAGMIAGLLLARAGIETIVLEKHADFLRDFRGDTIHPSTLQLFHELGLLEQLLERDHVKLPVIHARVAGETIPVADFRHLPVAAPYIALMPQWHFLDFVAEAAARYPRFTLRREAEAVATIETAGRTTGVRLASGDEVQARLVIAADGRHSVLRAQSGLPQRTIGAPMDVFWFRLPKTAAPDNETMGVFEAGRLFVLIDRRDYWQCAFVFPKGRAEEIRAEGIHAFRRRVAAVGAETAAGADAIADWDDVKLLTVSVDRLETWHKSGLLFIGDAAHAMSPIGGVGINLAIQDAVAAANILAGPMARGEDIAPLLAGVQARRMLPTRLTQGMQQVIQNRVIAPLLDDDTAFDRPPWFLRLFATLPLLRRLPARAIGLGFRPEHVRSPEA